MRSISSSKLLLATALAVGVITAFSLSREALAQNPPVGKNAIKAEPNIQKTKVFRLVRTDPEEVREVMATMLDFITPPPPAPPMPMQPIGMLGMGGGFGGGPAPFAIAAEPRTKSIIVRGTEKHIQLAADLVAVVDHPQGKEPPEVKSLRAVVLKHAKPDEISSVVEGLELDARMVALPAAKMVIFTGSDQVMKDIADLIKELDVPAEPEPKKEEKRRLLGDPADKQ